MIEFYKKKLIKMQKIFLVGCLLLLTFSVSAKSVAGEEKTGIGALLEEKVKGFCSILKDLIPDKREANQRYPVDELKQHLVDIHFYSGDLNTQYVAHHYCTAPKNGFQECILYDHDDPDAKIIGTEFVIHKDIYEKLPDDEKHHWHSHIFEVQSGLLVAPDVSEEGEMEIMEFLIQTYGKVVDVWHQGLDLPIGTPLLANALALDSQVDWEVADYMDRVLNLKTTHRERREKRKSLKVPDLPKDSNLYLQTGKALQYKAYFKDIEDNGKVLKKKVSPEKSKQKTYAQSSSHDPSEF